MAAALIAVGFADPLVESIANSGVFGGHYADNNHLGVVPTLLLGAAFCLAIVAARCLGIVRLSSLEAGSWIVDAAKAAVERRVSRDLPYVFIVQIAALFVLESAEQVVSGGKLAGGTAWLGGPVVFSLVAHALVGFASTLALRSILRAVVRGFAAIVLTAIRYVWLAIARATNGGLEYGFRETTRFREQALQARRIGGRAPPILPIPA